MRINQDCIRRFRLRNFYNLFRELYGEVLSDAEINTILENYEFITVGFVPNLCIYQEVDVPSQEIANYFIALRENAVFKPRFIIRWSRVPLTTGETTNMIGEIELISDMELNELFCESHEFIIGTSAENQIDSEFLIQVITTSNDSERAVVMRQHLEEIVSQNDSRQNRADYLLEKYGFRQNNEEHI